MVTATVCTNQRPIYMVDKKLKTSSVDIFIVDGGSIIEFKLVFNFKIYSFSGQRRDLDQ